MRVLCFVGKSANTKVAAPLSLSLSPFSFGSIPLLGAFWSSSYVIR